MNRICRIIIEIMILLIISGCYQIQSNTMIHTPLQEYYKTPINTSTSTKTITPTFTFTNTNTSTSTPVFNYSKDWPMWGYDAQNSFWNRKEDKLFPPLKMEWVYDGGLEPGMSSEDNVLLSEFSYDTLGKPSALIALDVRQGLNKWKYTLIGGAEGLNGVTPTIHDGIAYFGGQGDDYIYAIDVNSGKLLWKHDGLGSMLSRNPKIYNDILYAAGQNNIGAYSLLTGNIIWRIDTEIRQSSIAITDGVLFQGGYGFPLRGLDAYTGKSLWSSKGMVGYQIIATGTSVYVIYSGDNPNKSFNEWDHPIYDYIAIAAFDINNGNKIWETQMPEKLDWWTSMAFIDNSLYVGANEKLILINPKTGEIIQQKKGFTRIFHIIGANGVIYVCGYSNKLIALKANDLSDIWQTNDSCYNIIVANSKLILGTTRGEIIAYTNMN